MYLRLFLLSLSVFLSFVSPAQKSSKKYPKITYLNKDNLTQKYEEGVYYARKIDQVDGQLMITEYFYPNLNVRMNGFIFSENPINIMV